MKIRAAILEKRVEDKTPLAKAKPLVFDEIELDPPGPGEVLVKIAAAGLCHSDLSVINGDRPRPMPMVLGHEASGIIQEIGPEVAGFLPGDHVVFVFVPSCGQCACCASGRPALCEPGAKANNEASLLGGHFRLRRKGEPLYHHMGVSGFAEYAVVSQNSLVKIDKHIPLNIAAMVGCAVLTGAGAVFNGGTVKPGSSVSITGLGGVGLSALIGAKIAGAAPIIAIDRLSDKFEMACQLGATHVFSADDDDLVEKVREVTGGGVDTALELAGAVPALEAAIKMTRRGGTTMSAGLPHPSARLEISPLLLVAEERSLRGSYLGSGIPRRDIPQFLRLYEAGKMPFDKLLTHTIRLDELNEAFDRLNRGEAIRQLIAFD